MLLSVEVKPGLRAMRDSNTIRGFHMVKFDLGHRATNFPRWFDSREPYEVCHPATLS